MANPTNAKVLAKYYKFHSSSGWEGSGEELAEITTEFGLALGILDDSRHLSERLIRDYVSREIIDKPERRGKEAIYKAIHVDQLLEARQLINSGMKLQALPALMKSREVADMRLDSREYKDADNLTTAQHALKEIKAEYSGRGLKGKPLLGTPNMGVLPRTTDLDERITQYSSTVRASDQQKELHFKLSGEAKDFPSVEQTTIDLAKGVQLVLQPKNIGDLTEEKIRLIAESVELLIKKAKNAESSK